MSVQALPQELDKNLQLAEYQSPRTSPTVGTRSPSSLSQPTLALQPPSRDLYRGHYTDEESSDASMSSQEPERGEAGGGTCANDEHSTTTTKKQRKPSFFPPLYLARRTFIFEKLKEYGIRSVADLGCGEGTLLSILSIPALHSDDFPSIYPPSTPAVPSIPSSYVSSSSSSNFPTLSSPDTLTTPQSKSDKLSILRSIPRPSPERSELHLRKLVGVDSDPQACQLALQVVSPKNEQGQVGGGGDMEGLSRWAIPDYRFEELTSQVFNGNVEVFNESLEDCECLVLTEVIEHMPTSALSKLPNLLFNVYSPRLIIITTPNHLFNPYFPPPSPTGYVDESHLFPDPTHRTNPPRVFRDPTHLFEFTPDEFREWCQEILDSTGNTEEYSLSFKGVGSLSSYYSSTSSIPFPPPSLSLHHEALKDHQFMKEPIRDPSKFYATQIAVFEKKFSNESERSPRSARPVPLPFFTTSSSTTTTTNGDRGESVVAGESGKRKEEEEEKEGGGGKLTTTTTTTKPHELVGSFVHKSIDSGEEVKKEVVLDELERIFNSRALPHRYRTGHDEGEEEDLEIGWMVLSEIWRVGGMAQTIEYRFVANEEEEGGLKHKESQVCLREKCRGEIGALVAILIEEEDWIFERVGKDDQGEEGVGGGRGKEGIEALRVGWKGWKADPIFGSEKEEEEYGDDDDDDDEEEVPKHGQWTKEAREKEYKERYFVDGDTVYGIDEDGVVLDSDTLEDHRARMRGRAQRPNVEYTGDGTFGIEDWEEPGNGNWDESGNGDWGEQGNGDQKEYKERYLVDGDTVYGLDDGGYVVDSDTLSEHRARMRGRAQPANVEYIGDDPFGNGDGEEKENGDEEESWRDNHDTGGWDDDW
ncbi:hypothetical protein JCM16303_006788 [Sporobolomyces ruberrimus]